MKISRFSFMALIALGSIIAFGPMAQGQEQGQRQGRGRGMDPEQQLKLYVEQLKLNGDQQDKVKVELKSQADKMAKLREDTALSQEDRRAKMTEIRNGFNAKMKEILTADQYKKFEEMRTQGRGRGGQGGGGGGQRRNQTN